MSDFKCGTWYKIEYEKGKYSEGRTFKFKDRDKKIKWEHDETVFVYGNEKGVPWFGVRKYDSYSKDFPCEMWPVPTHWTPIPEPPDEYIKSRFEEENKKIGLTLSSLMIASATCKFRIVKLLIEEGVKVNERDNAGYTALTWACREGHHHIADFLIKKGADVNNVDKNNETALMISKKFGRTKCVEILKKAGAKE